MDSNDRSARRHIRWLRSSSCTTVRLERRRRALIRGWQELIRERAALARDKEAWFRPCGSGDRRRQPRRFCFVLRRMKRTWREADRRNDATGRPVGVTVGSSDARARWFDLLRRVLEADELVRVRHQYFDEPVLLVTEEHYRELETAAGGACDRGGEPGERS